MHLGILEIPTPLMFCFWFSLLKVAAGFYRYDGFEAHPETPVKRCSYVRCIVQLVCKCSFIWNISDETLAVVINNLLSEIENVMGQSMYYIPLI